MSDALSILTDFVRRRAIPCPTDDDPDAIYFDNGHAREALAAIEAAGFRIISKDEVDPVTVERCIAAVEAAAPAETEEWNVHRAWVLRGVDAIRAIGRKE